MTLKQNTSSGGTNGTDITVLNSGGSSGDAFTALNQSATGYVKFSDAHPAHGSMGKLFNPPANSLGAVVYGGYSVSSIVCRRYYYHVASAATANCNILSILNATRGVARCDITTAGAIILIELRTGATLKTTALTPGTLYRIELAVDVGADTTHGYINYAVYVGDSDTPLDSYTSSVKNMDGPAPISNVQYGRTYSSTGTLDDYSDEEAVNDGTTTFIGPAANIPPSVNASSDQIVEPFTTVNLSGTVNDIDGSIASYSWSLVSSTGPTSPSLNDTGSLTPSYTSKGTWHTGHVDTWRLSATDNQGATNHDDVVVTVLPATRGLIKNAVSGLVQALKHVLL